MSLFDKLLVAHLVGDWLLQTEWQALNKGKNYRALFSHIAIYSVVMFAAILVAGFGLENIRVYIAVAMFALTHAFLDRGWFVPRFLKAFRMIVERKPERWMMMVVDQIFHIVTLVIAVLILVV